VHSVYAHRMEPRDAAPGSSDADALAFPLATAAEAHRASQKDHFYSQLLYAQAQQTAQTVLGSERANAPELRAATTIAYYGLTLGRCVATPGEEYCDMTRVHAQSGSHASAGRRWVCCIMYSLLPYAYSKITTALAATLRSVDPEEAWQLHAAAPWLQALSGTLDKLRLIASCLGSRYLHIADVTAGLAQVRHANSELKSSSLTPVAALMAAELTIRAATAVLKMRSGLRARRRLREFGLSTDGQSPAQADLGPGRTCPLCLSPRKNPTAGRCGHIFCWACVHEWVAEKPECPLCRKPTTPQSLLRLQSYA